MQTVAGSPHGDPVVSVAEGLGDKEKTWLCTTEFCATCTLPFLKNNALKIKSGYKKVDLKKKNQTFRDGGPKCRYNREGTGLCNSASPISLQSALRLCSQNGSVCRANLPATDQSSPSMACQYPAPHLAYKPHTVWALAPSPASPSNFPHHTWPAKPYWPFRTLNTLCSLLLTVPVQVRDHFLLEAFQNLPNLDEGPFLFPTVPCASCLRLYSLCTTAAQLSGHWALGRQGRCLLCSLQCPWGLVWKWAMNKCSVITGWMDKQGDLRSHVSETKSG